MIHRIINYTLHIIVYDGNRVNCHKQTSMYQIIEWDRKLPSWKSFIPLLLYWVFEISCDMSLAEFGPLAADLCIMVRITVLLCKKNFKIYFVILLALEGATLGHNLFIILETIILYYNTIHSQSEGLKDVTMNCDYYKRIFIIRITLLFISTVLIITFSLVSVQLLKHRKRKSKTESSVDEVDLNQIGLNWD